MLLDGPRGRGREAVARDLLEVLERREVVTLGGRSHRLSCDTQLGVACRRSHLPLLDQGDGVGCFQAYEEPFEVLGDT